MAEAGESVMTGAVVASRAEAVGLAVQIACAHTCRAHASTLRLQGRNLLAAADAMEAEAERWERGEMGAQDTRATYELVRTEDRKPDQLQPIAKPLGEGEDYIAAGPEGMTPEMQQWLMGFHERFRSSRFFTQVVNAAAAMGLMMTNETAREVAAEVQRMEEEARHSGERPDVEPRETNGHDDGSSA